jgi:N-hydroxyarylamine O-acetyltransferase
MSNNWRSNLFVYNPDVDAYFQRIKYSGSKEPTVETLQQIQWHHLLAIPFETLDIHTLGSVDIAPDSIEKKIVGNGRGGFCYENNILLLHVLRKLGYSVTPIISRTRWNRPVDIASTPTHLVLKVDIDGILWLADVGFSSFGSPYALRIETDEVQATPLEPRRITREGEMHIHQLYVLGKWCDMYSFTLNESYPMDWEMGAYYVATHPTCPAKLQIIVSMPTKTCRHLLLDNVLNTRYPDGRNETMEVWTESDYKRVLREVFSLHLPEEVRICPPKIAWKENA